MKTVRHFRPELDFAETKCLIDHSPSTIGAEIQHADAFRVVGLFLHTGANMELTDNFRGRVEIFGPN